MFNKFRHFIIGLGVLALAFTLTGCSKRARAEKHNQEGERNFQAGDYVRAEINFRNVLSLDPRNTNAIRRFGQIFYEQGLIERAAPFIGSTWNANPGDLDAGLKWARLLWLGNRTNEARGLLLTNILAKAPAFDEAIYFLVETCRTSNEVAAGRELVRASRQKSGDKAAFHVADGAFLLRERNVKGAEAEFRAAAALETNSISAHLALANLLVLQNDLKAAEAEYKIAVDLSPLRSAARLRLADFKLKNSQPEESRAILEDLNSKAPDFVPAAIQLAEVNLSLKKPEECEKIVKRVLAQDPRNYAAQNLQAQVQLGKGQLKDALAGLEKLSTTWPRDPALKYRLAMAYLLNQDLPKALSSLDQCLLLDPNLVEAALLQADLNLRRGNAPAAINSLRDLIQRFPKLQRAYFSLADACRVQRSWDEAASLYRQIAQQSPTNSRAPFLLGTVLRQQNKPTEARQAFEKARELAPDDLDVLTQLANLDLQDKNPAAAQQRIEQRIQKDPKVASLRMLLAQVYLAQTNYPQAEVVLKKAIADEKDLGPEVRNAYFLLSQLYFSQQNTNQAEAILKQALERKKELGPEVINAYTMLAQLYVRQQQTNQAEAVLKQAVADEKELGPNARNAYVMLARLYVGAQRQQEAIGNMDQLLAKNPQDLGALILKAMVFENMEKFKEAADNYEALLKVQATNVVVLNNLAYLCSEHLNRLEDAHGFAQRARQTAPQDPAIADTLGWILYKRGDFEGALTLLQESVQTRTAEQEKNIRSRPPEPEILYHLGMTHFMLGKEKEARTILKEALQTPAPFPGREEAVKSLASLDSGAAPGDSGSVAGLEKQLAQQPKNPLLLRRLAAAYESSGEVDKAAAHYQKLLDINPRDSSGMLSLARVYLGKLNNPKTAMEWARKARELAPDNPQAAHILGQAAFRAGDYRLSAGMLEESARKSPADPQVFYDFAWALYSVGRVPEAVAAMQTALQSTNAAVLEEARKFTNLVALVDNPARIAQSAAQINQLVQAGEVPAIMVAARQYLLQTNTAAARQAYELALQKYPLFAPAVRDLAVLLAGLGTEDARARELAVKARETMPQDAELAAALGKICYRRNEQSYAILLLKEALPKLPNDADLLYCLGLAQFKQKDAEANATLQKALGLNPAHKLAGEAKKAIEPKAK